MLYFHKQRLVILSTRKNGTSSIETALGKRASIALRFPPALKHMPYPGFMSHVMPMIEATNDLHREDIEVVATMREPVSWLESWFRYRRRENTVLKRSTKDITFEKFVREYLKPSSKAYARAGNQLNMFGDKDQLGVDRIFAFENFGGFVDYLSERLGKKIDLPMVNVSEPHPTELNEATRAQLVDYLATPIEFHGMLNADGTLEQGHRDTFAREFEKHPVK